MMRGVLPGYDACYQVMITASTTVFSLLLDRAELWRKLMESPVLELETCFCDICKVVHALPSSELGKVGGAHLLRCVFLVGHSELSTKETSSYYCDR